MIGAFYALPEHYFEAIVPQEWGVVQFMGIPRNSPQIIAKKQKLACQPVHRLKI